MIVTSKKLLKMTQLWFMLGLVLGTAAMETSESSSKPIQEEPKLHLILEHQEAATFMKKIFNKYGEGGVMTYEGFEHLLSSLGVGNLEMMDHDIHDHYSDQGKFQDLHSNHNHSVLNMTIAQTGPTTKSSRISQNHIHKTNERPKRAIAEKSETAIDLVEENTQCSTAAEILTSFHLRYDQPITEDNFLHICPAIIYEIDKHFCKNTKCDDIHTSLNQHLEEYHAYDHNHHGNESFTSQKLDFWNIPGKTWGYAVLAVTIISLVGLVCVAIIPIMQRYFFNHLIQFLVALAIGSLTGDALLHLIPHALIPHSEASHEHSDGGGDDHSTAVYKGLAVLTGLYLFFLAERGLAFVSEWRQKKNLKKTRSKIADPGELLEEYKRYSQLEVSIGEKLSRHNRLSFYDFSLALHPDGESYENGRENVDEELQQLSSHEQEAANNKLGSIDENVKDVEGHNNHKGHGHSHSAPGSVSSIAWMVIMGDGLHNFCDGLAIGASFASSITGGLSTSVAVFCHELPHELGDFAVLLNTGMSAKQALFYNLVSSVLCFMGVVIGLLTGNLENADSWIFCMAGGMFIYISLVDMLPEITKVAGGGEHKCCYLLLHCLGISTGISIMLLIALYEDKISLGLGDDAV